jgi:hypothetical protein
MGRTGICNLHIRPTSSNLLAKIRANAWPRSATWQALGVADDLADAAARYWTAQQRLAAAKEQVHAERRLRDSARQELADWIIGSYRAGMRMRDLVQVTGLSREWIRQLLRAAGVEPD